MPFVVVIIAFVEVVLHYLSVIGSKDFGELKVSKILWHFVDEFGVMVYLVYSKIQIATCNFGILKYISVLFVKIFPRFIGISHFI